MIESVNRRRERIAVQRQRKQSRESRQVGQLCDVIVCRIEMEQRRRMFQSIRCGFQLVVGQIQTLKKRHATNRRRNTEAVVVKSRCIVTDATARDRQETLETAAVSNEALQPLNSPILDKPRFFCQLQRL